MDKPEERASCPHCGFSSHLSTYDVYSKIATYICERCKEVFKKSY